MNVIKKFLTQVEKTIGILLGLFGVVVVLLMFGLVFVVFGEIAIIFDLFKVASEFFHHDQADTGQMIFLMLELVDLTLVSILIVIIATTAFRMIAEKVYSSADQELEKTSLGLLNMSGKGSKNLEAKLIFSVIGLAAVSILGAIFELSSKIEKGDFHYETIPVEYYIFGAAYLLLIVTSVAVILLSNAEKE
jgi:uncharacterized membrane protein YqhA